MVITQGNNTKESPMSSSSTVSIQNRRSFFKMTAAGAAIAIPGFALMNGTEIAFAESKPSLNDSDAAVLQFLAVAELVESDLWGQYCELATNNPDFGDAFAQIANIVNQPTVPTSEPIGGDELRSIAQTAAFHFAAIEQGGSSLYNSFMTKVTNLDVVAILASIGPMEVYHFAVFQTALERIRKLEGHDGPSFPDIRENPNHGDIMPEPCTFLDKSLPVCSVIRPRNTNTAGAVAAATGLVNSGLFLGQSQAFFDAVVPLAEAADAALRS